MRNLDYIFILVFLVMGYCIWDNYDMHAMNLSLWREEQENNRLQQNLIDVSIEYVNAHQ